MTTTTTRPCWQCGTKHQSDTMPALCSDPCVEAWQQRYQIAFGDEPAQDPVQHTNHGCNPDLGAVRVQVHNGTGWQEIPVGSVELNAGDHVPVQIIDEREPSTLAEHDQAVLDAWCASYPSSIPFINALSLDSQRTLARELRPVTWPGGFARARNRVLELHEAGHLGYLAASDEWIDHHGEPLVPPLQHVADRLARNGELPEFAEWFPAPSEDNRDFPTPDFSAYGTTVAEAFAGVSGLHAIARAAMDDEDRRAIAEGHNTDEPQALIPVRDQETAQQQRELGNPGPFFVVDTGEVCPPRPPEPLVTNQARASWWTRWFRRG